MPSHPESGGPVVRLRSLQSLDRVNERRLRNAEREDVAHALAARLSQQHMDRNADYVRELHQHIDNLAGSSIEGNRKLAELIEDILASPAARISARAILAEFDAAAEAKRLANLRFAAHSSRDICDLGS